MKKNLVLLIFCLMSFTFYGQNKVSYGYDAAGNRIKREVTLTRSAGFDEAGEQEVLSEMLQEHLISISPNPTKDLITISISGLDKNKGYIAIYNMIGNLIEQTDVLQAENTFDLSSLPSGIYIIQIRIDDKTTTWKVIKE